MQFSVSKNGKKLSNLDEDPKYRRKNSLKKVKKEKKFICDWEGNAYICDGKLSNEIKCVVTCFEIWQDTLSNWVKYLQSS